MTSKKIKGSKDSIVRKNDFSEKFIVFMFLVFATFVIVIFLQGSNLLGNVVSNLQLDKTSYNTSEYIKGTATLTLDPEDILPANSTLTFAILTNASKCQLSYACQNGISKPWHQISNTTGECIVYKQDPEGDCCMQDTNCSQIILNHDFDAGTTRWQKNTGVTSELEYSWYDSAGESHTSSVIIENGESLSTNYTQYLSQSFTGRMYRVKDFATGGGNVGGTMDNIPVPAPVPYESLNGSIAWQEIYPGQTCAFEIVLRSNNSRGLHYYYKLNNVDSACNDIYKPNETEKYINRTLESSDPEIQMNWDDFHINIYSDWLGNGFNTTDYIETIQFNSYTKKVSDNFYTQRVIINNVTLTTKDGVNGINLTCTKNKKCCLAGTGYGNYYGDQISSCESGYECWQYCANSSKVKLSTFLTKTGGRKNQTGEGECQALVNGNILPLEDYCEIGGLGVGKGYTAAYENGTVVSYRLNLSDSTVKLKVPAQNGTYIYSWIFSYLPISYRENPNSCGEDSNESCEIIIFAKAIPFTVGTSGSPNTCTANWTNCGNWSSCINGTETQTCQDAEQCPENAPTYMKDFTRSCGCIPDSYQCSGSLYQQCAPDGSTWNTIIDCATQGQSCDVTQNGCYTPCTPSCEGVSCNGSDGCGGTCTSACGTGGSIFKKWYFWVIVIVVLAGVLAFLLMTLLKGKKKGLSLGKGKTIQPGQAEYPELVSYIRDASATGATKADIQAKLIEAGWPNDAIEKSFKFVGM